MENGHTFTENGLDFMIEECMTQESVDALLASKDVQPVFGNWVWLHTVGPMVVAESKRFDSYEAAKLDAIRYANKSGEPSAQDDYDDYMNEMAEIQHQRFLSSPQLCGR